MYYYRRVLHMNIWLAGWYGIVSGVVGTGAGGFLACFLPSDNKRIISFILEYSAGLMLSIVCFDLLPNALKFTTLAAVLIGIVIGICFMMISDNVISISRVDTTKSTGLIVCLGIAIHNFLEGMAVGSGFKADNTLGFALVIAILLHDIPEGMSIVIPLRSGGMNRIRALSLSLLAGLPMGAGSMFGLWVGDISVYYIAVSLAVAGGAMLYIVFANMLPESKHMYKGRANSIGSLLGLITGLIIAFKFV